jgi:hypothetical protein
MEWTILEGEIYAVHPMVRCKGFVRRLMIGIYATLARNTRWMTTALPGLPEYIP